MAYCPATTSPFFSGGANEYGWRHLLQKPRTRPGRPSILLPTSAPQLPQKRWCSATWGSGITASVGSTTGIGGTLTIPPPMRLRTVVRVAASAVLRVGVGPDALSAVPLDAWLAAPLAAPSPSAR